MSINKSIDEFKRKLTFTGKVCKDDVIKLEKDIGCNFISSVIDPRTLSSVPSGVRYNEILRLCSSVDSNISIIHRVNSIVDSLNCMVECFMGLDGTKILGYEDLVFLPTTNNYKKFKDLTLSELVEMSGTLLNCIGRSLEPSCYDEVRDVKELRQDVSVLIGILRTVGYLREDNVISYGEDLDLEAVSSMEKKVYYETEFGITIDELFFLSNEVKKIWCKLSDLDKSNIVKEFDTIAYYSDEDFREVTFGQYISGFYRFFINNFTYKEVSEI